MDNSKRGHIPMQERLDLNKTQGASTPKEVKRMQNVPYASAVGSIMYAVRCTRPDVAFAQNITSRFQQNPGELHWTAVKNILKYLRNTKDMFLAQWTGKKKLQATVLYNVCYKKAEYIAALEAAMEAVWIRKFISGLGSNAAGVCIKKKCTNVRVSSVLNVLSNAVGEGRRAGGAVEVGVGGCWAVVEWVAGGVVSGGGLVLVGGWLDGGGVGLWCARRGMLWHWTDGLVGLCGVVFWGIYVLEVRMGIEDGIRIVVFFEGLRMRSRWSASGRGRPSNRRQPKPESTNSDKKPIAAWKVGTVLDSNKKHSATEKISSVTMDASRDDGHFDVKMPVRLALEKFRNKVLTFDMY
ncbi:hypothetical protein Tco_0267790 [Tanacetum coccineum]